MTRKEQRRRALQQGVARVERRLIELERVSNRYTWARLIMFAGGVLLAVINLFAVGPWSSVITFAATFSGFWMVTRLHHRVRDAIRRYTIWRAIKREHLARMDLNWAALPPELRFRAPYDPALELDLDLTGDTSLHRLLDTAVSREGSARLRDWLAAGVPDPARIAVRQGLVRDLVALPTFRDKLRLNGMLAACGAFWHWEGDSLRRWLDEQRPAASRRLLTGLIALAVLNGVLFLLTRFAGWPPLWGVSFIVYLGLYLWAVQRLGDPFGAGLALRDPLSDLRAVFAYLESAPYGRHERLRALCAPFLAADRPSVQLRRLEWVLAAASVRANPILWMLIGAVLPWDVIVAHSLERRRAALVRRLPLWLDAWFELEALGSLATLAYLNPEYTFPVIEAIAPCPPDGGRVGDGGALFEAQALGHPLIPDAGRVANDFAFRRLGDVALITGSNMSGKSTFLRTLGVNLCLAYAGGPVCARALHTIPFRLFTCIRVTDSVTDGISYFYAEVKRLKALLEALDGAESFPLFFLIDEIFRGTNNRERLIGSRSYLRALVGKRGVGVISTHDLELVHLADTLPQLTNYHFTESVGDGRLLFDYRLRTGPSPTTNALKIMQMEGLPVEEE